MRRIAAEPEGQGTRDCAELQPGVRSIHLRVARGRALQARVQRPVHVLYYRSLTPGLIEVIRVLHERMEPSRHLRAAAEEE
jgi:toxin ParE1/3/4